MHRISRAKIVITLSDINRVITKKRKKENDSVDLNREKNVWNGFSKHWYDSFEHLEGHNYICHSNKPQIIKNISAPLCSTFLKKEIHSNYRECGWGIEDRFKKDICHLAYLVYICFHDNI